MTAPTAGPIDVTDATFAQDVLEASKTHPVIVDFWAPWCGPCRVLGPIIEKVAGEHPDVILAKLNTDENPQAAMAYEIQGIPAVKAFRNGEVVHEFVGALPEEQVRDFFKEVAPTEDDGPVVRADAHLAAGDLAAAEPLYNEALAGDPDDPDALVGLAIISLERGEREAAEDYIERAGHDRRAKSLKHQLFLHDFAEKHANEDLQAEAANNPSDPRARYRWGVMLAAEDRFQEGLDELLESVRLDRKFADEAARKAILAVFDILGLDSPLTRDYQRQLSLILF